jgi:dephospho-CoA kinase
MRMIGVTGPSGSGKSLLSKYFSERGIPVIDADELYHSMLVPPSPCLDAIRERFGDEVISHDGPLDRGALSRIVFNSQEKLALLNETVLSLVLERVRLIVSELEAQGEDTVIIDAPTLIESGFNRECNTVISVIAPAEIRTKRICERDGVSLQRATERINAQKHDDFYISHSDQVIVNDSDEEHFKKQTEELAEKLGYNVKERKL